ncbi:MAG: glycosyltransferase family 2 protein [Verrucomicrobiota bacterium]|nr:glycosyltransferase family 2 protein [Verrucomicrobiota bacterium]
MNPKLSVIVIVHDMRREAPRTLFSLSPGYQRGDAVEDYEVLVIENGSSAPLQPDEVERIAPNFRYHRHETNSSSPVEAVNLGVAMARGECVAVCVDGARILSPGMMRYMLAAFRAFPNPFVYTLGWHLGEEVQNLSIKTGYDEAAEDRLLESVDWRANGYALFSISALALSCREGWFSPVAESNCFALRKSEFVRLGGFHPAFQAPGGGLVNLDFFALACAAPELTPVLLLGEGTFHQFHGGVATNVSMAEHPWEKFHEEYMRLRGKPYAPPEFSPEYLGRLSLEARRFLPPKS